MLNKKILKPEKYISYFMLRRGSKINFGLEWNDKLKKWEVKNNFKKFLSIFKNNPLLIIVSIIFLILFLSNKIYNYYNFTNIKSDKFIYIFPELKIEEKKKLQEKIIQESKKFKDVVLYIYRVKLGENYWQIARENGIDIDTIIGLNPYLKNFYAGINEELILGNKKGCIHICKGGERLIDICKIYGIDIEKLREVNRINFIKEYLYGFKEGEILFIPESKPLIVTLGMKKLYELRAELQSPLGGGYTSGFGTRIDPFTKERRFHNGLDIRVPIGTAVGASADGIVIAAGWANGYGKMIKIAHYNGYTTLYGHLSKIYVRVGQKVKRGQIIGRSGCTGRTTGPHLHFTVWYKSKPVNPALFLW